MDIPIQTVSKIENIISSCDETYIAKKHVIDKSNNDIHPMDFSDIVHQDFFIEMFKFSLPSAKLHKIFKHSTSLCRTVLQLHPLMCNLAGYNPDTVTDALGKNFAIRTDNSKLALLTHKSPVVEKIMDSVKIKIKALFISAYLRGGNPPNISNMVNKNWSLYMSLFDIGASVLPKHENDTNKNVYITNKTKICSYNRTIINITYAGHVSIYCLFREYIYNICDDYVVESDPVDYEITTPRWLVWGMMENVLTPNQFAELSRRRHTLSLYQQLSVSTGVPNISYVQYLIDNGAISDFPPPFDYSGKSLFEHALRIGDDRLIASIVGIMSCEELEKYRYTSKNVNTLKNIITNISK